MSGDGATSRRAVVTGGAHGIGAATARRLADDGADVLVLDLDDPGGGLRGLRVDLADAAAVVAAARAARQVLGGVDVLVNCAGIAYCAPLPELDLDRYHHVLAVNLHAPVLLMRELATDLASGGTGRVVNVTSVHGRVSEPGSLAYDVSKAGLEGATRTAALDLADSGVLVNAVAPGFVATRMSIVDGEDELESAEFRTVYLQYGRLPLGRASSPSEVAGLIAWLAGPDNTYCTGQVFTVDGALTSRL